MTLSIKGLPATISIMTLSITTLCIKCHYAECHNLIIVMLNVIKLSVIMLNVIKLSVVMLNVIMLNVIKLSVVILNVLMLSAMETLKIDKTVDATKHIYFRNLLSELSKEFMRSVACSIKIF